MNLAYGFVHKIRNIRFHQLFGNILFLGGRAKRVRFCKVWIYSIEELKDCAKMFKDGDDSFYTDSDNKNIENLSVNIRIT